MPFRTDILRTMAPALLQRKTGAFSPLCVANLSHTLRKHGYLITTLLGQGTYADVFRAQTLSWSKAATRFGAKAVAIKATDKAALNSEDVSFVRREFLAHLQASGHPNIVSLFEVIEDEASVCFVMELLSGPTLSSFLENERTPVGEKMALSLFKQVISALVHMHANGCAHRDIKPENVAFRSHPIPNQPWTHTLCLLDFGLASVWNADSSDTNLLSSERCGTLGYSSPEVNTAVRYDPRLVDIWGAGVLLFVIIEKKLPFRATEPFTLLVEARKRSGMLFTGSCWRSIGDATKTIIRSCLDACASRRPSAVLVYDSSSYALQKITALDRGNAILSTRSSGNSQYTWFMLWPRILRLFGIQNSQYNAPLSV